MQTNDGEKLNRLIFAVAKGNADCLDGIYALAGGKMYAVAFSLVGRASSRSRGLQKNTVGAIIPAVGL